MCEESTNALVKNLITQLQRSEQENEDICLQKRGLANEIDELEAQLLSKQSVLDITIEPRDRSRVERELLLSEKDSLYEKLIRQNSELESKQTHIDQLIAQLNELAQLNQQYINNINILQQENWELGALVQGGVEVDELSEHEEECEVSSSTY